MGDFARWFPRVGSARARVAPLAPRNAAVVQNDGAATFKFTVAHATDNEAVFAALSAENAAFNAKKAEEAAIAERAKAQRAEKKAQKEQDASEKLVIAADARDYFVKLVAEREGWEQNAYKTSNDQLYALLQKCYQFYVDMSKGTVAADGLRVGLNAYIGDKGYKFTSATHSLTKIVKCVFGVDRRRVSAYSIALRAALTGNVKFLPLSATAVA